MVCPIIPRMMRLLDDTRISGAFPVPARPNWIEAPLSMWEQATQMDREGTLRWLRAIGEDQGGGRWLVRL